MWLDWRSGCCQFQKSAVQIRSSAKFYVEKAKKRPGKPHLKRTQSNIIHKKRPDLANLKTVERKLVPYNYVVASVKLFNSERDNVMG